MSRAALFKVITFGSDICIPIKIFLNCLLEHRVSGFVYIGITQGTCLQCRFVAIWTGLGWSLEVAFLRSTLG